MNVEDVKREMQLLEGDFESNEVKYMFFWWRGSHSAPWRNMVKEMQATGVEEMIARYEIEKEET